MDMLAPIKRKVLRARDAAEYLGISVSAFRSLSREKIPALTITPGRRVWLVSDLDTYLSECAGRAIKDTPANPWDKIFANRQTQISENIQG